MALNALGLGFSFGGKDAGMGKQISDQTKHLSLMGQAVETLNKILSINRLQAFLDSVSLSKLGDIADGIAGMAEKGRNLTTSFEATLTASSKTGHAMAANFGYTAKEMGKFSAEATNLSISLNTSVEQGGKAAYAWAQGANELKLLGVDSAATAVKMAEVFNVDPSKLVFQLKEMKNGLGLTDDELKKVVSSTVAWGQQTGDVSKAMETLPAQIASMREHAHSLGKTLSGGQVAAYAESTNQAAQLMYMFTNNAETAQAAAQDLGKRLVGAGKDFSSMFAGTQTELPKFFESLAVSGVDVDEQFKLMKQGPLGFIKGMSSMVKKAGGFSNMTGDQMNFIKKHMEDALGPEMANQMFTLFQKGGDAVEEFAKKLPMASDNLGDLSKAAHRTGRTLAEQMDLQESMFVARLRTTSTVGQQFVKDTGKAYKEWGDKLIKISSGTGPLALISKKMIEMHQIGALALIPKTLRPMAGVFGSIAKESAPLIGMMGSLGFRLSMLMSPITLIVAGLALLAYWFVSVQKPGEKWTKTVARMGRQAGEFFSKTLPKYLKLGLAKLEQFGAYLGKVVPPLVKKFAKYLQKEYPKVVAALQFAFNQFFEKALPWIQKNIPPLMQKMGKLVHKWAPIITKGLLTAWWWVETELIKAVVWLGKKLWQYLPQIISTIGSLLKSGLDLAKEIVLGMLDGIRQFLVEKFPESADIINNAFQAVSDFITDLVAVIKGVIDTVVEGWKLLVDFVNQRMESQTTIFEDIWEGIKLMLWEVVSDIKFYFINLWLDVKKAAMDLWDGLKSAAAEAVKFMEQLLMSAVDSFTAPFRAVDDLVGKLFRNSISTDMKVDFDEATKHAKKFGKDVSSSMNVAVAPLSTAGVSTPGAKPLPPSIRKPMVNAGDTQASLLNAVNMPAWYARYESLFNARMSALEAAMAGAPNKGGGRVGAGAKASRGIGADDGMSHATATDVFGNPTKRR